MKHDILKFLEAINSYNEHESALSIGTLGERCLHAILKRYYEPDIMYHEINVCGYVADIFKEGEIIEIQTNNFSPLNRKLEKYLEEYNVTVVYPVTHTKYMNWLDPESGEMIKRYKSPKRGAGVEFLYEVSKLKKYINHPRLSFEILLIDMEEYKFISKQRTKFGRGSVRCDRKPLCLHSVAKISSVADLSKILPDGFGEEPFNTSDFSKVLKLKGRKASFSLNSLLMFGYIEKIGKEGNSIIYQKCQN